MKKIWGFKITLFKTKKYIVDILFLKPYSYCSIHLHKTKINIFYLLFGIVRIDIFPKFYEKNSHYLSLFKFYMVKPKIIHRFVVLCSPTIMIEISTSLKEVKEDDIHRFNQGGRITEGQYISENDLKERKNVRK